MHSGDRVTSSLPNHNAPSFSPKSSTGHLQRTDLNSGRTSSDSVVSDGGVAPGQDDVGLTRYGCGAVRRGWDREAETSVDGRCTAESLVYIALRRQRKDLRSEDWAGDGDESGIDLRLPIRSNDDGTRGQKGDFGAGGDVAVLGRGREHGECL